MIPDRRFFSNTPTDALELLNGSLVFPSIVRTRPSASTSITMPTWSSGERLFQSKKTTQPGAGRTSAFLQRLRLLNQALPSEHEAKPFGVVAESGRPS